MDSLVSAVQQVFFENPENDPDLNCMPWAFPPKERCDYVIQHTTICGEGAGLVPYMKIHYCTFEFRYIRALHSVPPAPFVLYLTCARSFLADDAVACRSTYCPAMLQHAMHNDNVLSNNFLWQ